jgi:hypothetical protein
MDAVMSLAVEQRRALKILADAGQNGAAEAIMLAHGFRPEMLAGLVLGGLATVVTKSMRAGGPTIKVEHYFITDDGRTAIGVE